MHSQPDKPHDGDRWSWAVAAGFWVAYAACLTLWVRPEMLYTAFGRLLPYPVFELTGDFAFQALTRPGGFSEYLAGLLSQGLSAPALAIAVILAVAMSVSLAMGLWIRSAGRSVRTIGVYIPALMILIATARFSHPMTSCLSLATGVWAAAMVRRFRFRRAGLDWAVFALVAAGVYWIAGGGVWMFGILSAMDGLRNRAFLSALVQLGLIAGIAAGLGIALQGWPAAKALLYPMPFGSGWGLNLRNIPLSAIQILWLWPVGIGLVILLAERLTSRKTRSPLSRTRSIRQSRFVPAILGLAWVAAVPLTVLTARDPISSGQLWVIHFGRMGQWDDLLDSAAALPPSAYNLYLNYEIDRALAHTDQMGERLLAYPQSPLGLLLSAPAEAGDPEPTYNIDLLIELGCVNLAEHAAMELLEVKGNLPFVLEWLATIYTVKESPETAAVFLNRLAAIPAHRGKARRLLAELASDPEMKNDGRIRWLRACNPQKDLVTFDLGPEGLFDYLLDRNPSNRMAWDYRMAIYLLTQQVDKVAAHLPELERFGATVVPRHYAEALAIYRARGGQPAGPDTLELPGGVEEQARVFLETCQRLRGDRGLAMRTLAKEYGDSYFYYYTFGVSGVKE